MRKFRIFVAAISDSDPVPLFGPGRPVFKVRRSRAKFHVFVAVISELGMCCATIV